MKLDVSVYTNSGGREYNEDFADGCIEETEAFFVLADGLGGHIGGEQASSFVGETFVKAWRERAMKMPRTLWMKQQITCINHALIKLQDDCRKKMKSTVAALCLEDKKISWAYVGDSRIYYLTKEGITCLTKDHSVTYKKYLSREIEKEDIPFDEDRSSLLRAVGDAEHSIPDYEEMIKEEKGFQGDAFLLCSDGFWEYLREEEILIDYLKSQSAKDWGNLMLLRLMQRISPKSDNLTFIAIRVVEDAYHLEHDKRQGGDNR